MEGPKVVIPSERVLAIQQMKISSRIAATKRQGSQEAFKHQLDVIRAAMIAQAGEGYIKEVLKR